MYKKAIIAVFWTLILFNTQVFSAWEPLLQATSVTNYKVKKIYTNFADKLNIRINAKLSTLTGDSRNELADIAREIEADFIKIDSYVRTGDRQNGIATVNHINTLVGRIKGILASWTPAGSYTQVASTATTTVDGKSQANAVDAKPTNILYYADNFEWGGTSGGNTFSQAFFSSANCDAPLHSFIQVVNAGKSVLVKNNDRPNCRVHPDIVDLSTSAFRTLAPLSRGKLSGGFVTLADAGKAYTKKYIPTDFFNFLNVELDANIPNAYLKNETIHISGRVKNDKDTAILFFILPSGKRFDVASTVQSGRFEFSVPLAESGKYRMVVASGNGFETTQFFEFQVFDASVFAAKKLFATEITPIDSLTISRKAFRDLSAVNVIEFPGDMYREVMIEQGSRVVRSSGIGDIAFWPDAFKDFQMWKEAHIIVTAARSTTNFSHDTYTTPAVVFDRNMKLSESWGSESNEKLEVSLADSDIHVRGYLSPGARVAKEIYVTRPDGTVVSYDFDSQYIDDSGKLLRTDGIIDQKIPADTDGLYVVEVNYDNGFAALNTPITRWTILPLGMNPEDRVTNKDIAKTTLDTVRALSLAKVNELRQSVWAKKVWSDVALDALAQIKAKDMADNNYVGHVDSKGVKILGTAKNNNIEVVGAVGENVAGGNINAEVLIAGLMMSGWHRKNMLDESWTRVGIGYAEKDGKVYYAQIFGE